MIRELVILGGGEIGLDDVLVVHRLKQVLQVLVLFCLLVCVLLVLATHVAPIHLQEIRDALLTFAFVHFL